MDNETFKMVDGIIARNRDTDGRANAEVLLDIGAKKGHLQKYAQVIATRYCLRPEAVIGWYETVRGKCQKLRILRR